MYDFFFFMNSETKPDIKKKERRKEDKKKNDTNTQVGDTSEEDIPLSSEGKNEKSAAVKYIFICRSVIKNK